LQITTRRKLYLKEEIAKESASDMDEERREQIRKSDRGGEYSISHEMK
jgi:hypothetical protein